MTLSLDLAAQSLPSGDAVFSADRRYRYRLSRRWAPGPLAVFCLLNPSQAGADTTDPTLSKGVVFAKRWGFGGLVYVNEHAYVLTDSRELPKVQGDIIGPDNDQHIVDAAKSADLFVVAWGTGGGLRNRDRAVLELVRSIGVVPHCLRVTQAGFPEHLLYLPGTLKPTPYVGRPE